ncbi:hypothetical protein RFI_05337, partial [Reticulomyxa filosa]
NDNDNDNEEKEEEKAMMEMKPYPVLGLEQLTKMNPPSSVENTKMSMAQLDNPALNRLELPATMYMGRLRADSQKTTDSNLSEQIWGNKDSQQDAKTPSIASEFEQDHLHSYLNYSERNDLPRDNKRSLSKDQSAPASGMYEEHGLDMDSGNDSSVSKWKSSKVTAGSDHANSNNNHNRFAHLQNVIEEHSPFAEEEELEMDDDTAFSSHFQTPTTVPTKSSQQPQQTSQNKSFHNSPPNFPNRDKV